MYWPSQSNINVLASFPSGTQSPTPTSQRRRDVIWVTASEGLVHGQLAPWHRRTMAEGYGVTKLLVHGGQEAVKGTASEDRNPDTLKRVFHWVPGQIQSQTSWHFTWTSTVGFQVEKVLSTYFSSPDKLRASVYQIALKMKWNQLAVCKEHSGSYYFISLLWGGYISACFLVILIVCSFEDCNKSYKPRFCIFSCHFQDFSFLYSNGRGKSGNLLG